ncbi:TPA: type VI secretion system baseplate subunit TssK, partial [Escherichia coli]
LICNFDEYGAGSNSDYYIKLTSDTFRKNKLIALPEIKIAPSEHIDMIIQHALPGIKFTVMDAVTSDLQVRENTIWLKIDKHSELWTLAQTQKRVAFYWSCSPDDLLVELVLSQEKYAVSRPKQDNGSFHPAVGR